MRANESRHCSLALEMKPPCVFCGPSLAGHVPPSGIDIFPPATRGALATAVRAGYTRIGIIDGAIDDGARVPLREFGEVLATPKINLIGGASMGASRAARLEAAGMRGIGRVFRLFRRGCLSAREEIYVLHAPAPLHYRCLTLPLVNIRYTLRFLRRSGYLEHPEEQAITQYMQDLPWFDRDRHSLSAAMYGACGRWRCGPAAQAFDACYRDVKREDALLVLRSCLRRSVL
jgi:hypothetical protein